MSRSKVHEAEEATRELPTPFFITMQPEPGSEHAPNRSFRVVNELAQLDSLYEGRGLTLDRVIAEETGHFGSGSHHAYDLAFYENEQVAAVVRHFGDGTGAFKVLPIGDEAPGDEAEDDEEADAPPVKFDHTYAEARTLAVSICRKAAVDYHEAEARLAKGRERAAHAKHVTGGCTDADTPHEAEEWARWLNALETGRNDAERRLIGCILLSFGRIDRVDEIDEQEPGWKPVAFELDGPHYVVAPSDEDDPRPGRPYLFVVDGADFDSQDYGASGGMPDFHSGKPVDD